MYMYAGLPPTPPPPSPPPPSPRSLTRSPPPGPGRSAATTHRARSWLPRALAPPPCPRPFRHSSPSSCSGRGSWPSGTPCATLGRRRRNARSQCASRSDWCCARPGVSEHQPCFRWPVSWNSASYGASFLLNSPPQALAQAEKRNKQFWQFPRVGNWLAGGSVSWKPAGWLRRCGFQHSAPYCINNNNFASSLIHVQQRTRVHGHSGQARNRQTVKQKSQKTTFFYCRVVSVSPYSLPFDAPRATLGIQQTWAHGYFMGTCLLPHHKSNRKVSLRRPNVD